MERGWTALSLRRLLGGGFVKVMQAKAAHLAENRKGAMKTLENAS